MVYSEFGRRVQRERQRRHRPRHRRPDVRARRGVHGGFYGEQPSLTDLDDGDLKAGTDFRSVYASLLGSVLGAEPGAVLDGWERRVDGLFA